MLSVRVFLHQGYFIHKQEHRPTFRAPVFCRWRKSHSPTLKHIRTLAVNALVYYIYVFIDLILYSKCMNAQKKKSNSLKQLPRLRCNTLCECINKCKDSKFVQSCVSALFLAHLQVCFRKLSNHRYRMKTTVNVSMTLIGPTVAAAHLNVSKSSQEQALKPAII